MCRLEEIITGIFNLTTSHSLEHESRQADELSGTSLIGIVKETLQSRVSDRANGQVTEIMKVLAGRNYHLES